MCITQDTPTNHTNVCLFSAVLSFLSLFSPSCCALLAAGFIGVQVVSADEAHYKSESSQEMPALREQLNLPVCCLPLSGLALWC